MKRFFTLSILSLALFACGQQTTHDTTPTNTSTNIATSLPLDSLETAYFASGCFWCVEAIFESVEGVQEAISGYSGGSIPNPSYELICTGKTKHAEAVQVYYNPKIVSFETLVDVFFNSHDPSTLHQQGPDTGPQYRSIAFYQNQEEKNTINKKITSLKKKKTFSKITTEVTAFDIFYSAEDYHQNYERNHPNQGYVKSVSIPRLNAFKKKMPEILKAEAKLH
ncbi:MAG: peptide-methionine (S)-S-oxide reductase MsrA [Crocinitomicaceae bacterium]|nr:peptide-methionine (S)-S-oxide reductase MsrA [Crocinitomicaceae bacterium]